MSNNLDDIDEYIDGEDAVTEGGEEIHNARLSKIIAAGRKRSGPPREAEKIYDEECRFDLVNWAETIKLPTIMMCSSTLGTHELFAVLVSIEDVERLKTSTVLLHSKTCRMYDNCPALLKSPSDGGQPAGYIFDDLTSLHNHFFSSGVSGPKNWCLRVSPGVWITLQHVLGARKARLALGLTDLFENSTKNVAEILPVPFRMHISVAKMCAEKSISKTIITQTHMEEAYLKSRRILENWDLQIKFHTIQGYNLQWSVPSPKIRNSDLCRQPECKTTTGKRKQSEALKA